MTPTGIFVTKEELEHVKLAQKMSGMWMSGGEPWGDPEYEVQKLTQKYHPPQGSGLNLKDGQFYLP